MTEMTIDAPSGELPVQPRAELFHRHALAVRVTHWINALAMVFLIMTGLNIFNAHPALYWGQYGADDDDARRWLEIGAADRASGEAYGFLRIGELTVETTGVLGISTGKNGAAGAIGYPHWATFPSYRDLGTARNFHFFFAWVMVINGLIYLAYGIFSGHIARNLMPRLRELRPANVWHDVVQHARLRFPKGEEAKRYHVLQKLAYGGVVMVLIPGMVWTGLGMSPGINASAPFLLEMVGGRQSARSLHWIFANLIMVFIAVHLLMVLLSGPINGVRSMITGRLRL